MKNRRPWTYVTAALLAGVSGVTLYQAIAGAEATRRVEAAIARVPGLHVGSVSVDPWSGRVVVARLSGKIVGGAISVSRLVFQGRPSVLPAFIATAHAAGGTATAENIEIDVGQGKVHIPKVEATGTELGNDELAKIFDPKSPAPLTDRMANFTAEKISMPEVSLDVTAPTMTQKIVYKDIELTGVVKGKIAEFKSGAGTFSATLSGPGADTGPLEGAFGASTAKNLDMSLYARLMTESRKDADEALAPLYETFEVDGIELKSKAFAVKTGKLSGSKVMVRPFVTSIADFQKLVPNEPGVKPTPEQTKKSMEFLADIYESMDLGTTEVKDIAVTFGEGDKAGSVKLARMGLAEFAKARIGELAADGFELTGPKVLVKFDSFALRGFDFKSAVTALKTLPIDNPAAMGAMNPRSLLPTLDQIVMTGLDAAVPAKGGNGNADGGDTTKFKLGKVDIKASNYLLGIPSALSLAVEHLALQLPAGDRSLRPLIEMGYGSLDLTSKFELAWNEAASTLTLKESSLKGEGMGTVSLKGVFGNVTKDLFVGDMAVVQAAALGASVVEADLRVENDGLITKLLEMQAKQAGVSVDQLRQGLVQNAKASIPQMLGASTQANAIQEAIVAFIQDPKSIEIIAKSAKGLGAADFPLLQNPPELIKRLDIQATANH